MEKKSIKKIFFIFVLFVTVLSSIIYIYPQMVHLFSTADINLIEINDQTILNQTNIIYDMEKEFEKYSELEELFLRVPPSGDVNYLEPIIINEKKAVELRDYYMNNRFCWNGSYYRILVAIS